MVSTKQGTGWLIGVNRRPYYGPLATAMLSPNSEPRIGTGVLSWKLPFTSKFRVFFSPHLPTNYRTWVPTSLWNVGKQMLDTLTSQVFVQTVNVVQLLAGGLSRRRFLRFGCHDWAVEIWDVVYKKFHIFEKDCLTVKIQKPFCLIFCDFILWIFSHCFRKNGRNFMFRFSGFNAQASGQCLCTRNGSNDQHTARKIGSGAS